jgi:hypothetical protein
MQVFHRISLGTTHIGKTVQEKLRKRLPKTALFF